MTVKELYSKYKGYDIILFGRPLDQKTIPFSFKDLKYKTWEYYKGTVSAYCVKEEVYYEKLQFNKRRDKYYKSSFNVL